MISIKAEFYQGSQGQLFRLLRTPEQITAHMIFIAPLFEQANQTRHHITRSAINAYEQGMQAIVFDHFGTGDSEGELVDASLTLWQQDIVLQLKEIKVNSEKAIHLSIPLSAVLLLCDEILDYVTGIILLQPDFNGKRFVQQFKRLALARKIDQRETLKKENTDIQQVVDIAGYQIKSSLLDELATQGLAGLADFDLTNYWFEWQKNSEDLSPGRIKQQQALANKNTKLIIQSVDDVKFWQATELQVAHGFLSQEKLAFAQLLAAAEVNAC